MAGEPSASLPAPGRLLVRGVNWLGDAVMTTPALLRLRENFAGARISLLTPAKLADLWQYHPAVDEVIPFAPRESVFAVAGRLRGHQFDLALVLPNSPRSALEVFFAGIRRRVGRARPGRNFFLTQVVPARPEAVKMHKRTASEIRRLIVAPAPAQRFAYSASSHQLHEYLHLAAALGGNPAPLPPQLFVTPGETEAAGKKFGLEPVSGLVLGLNAGAEYGPAKRWPAERFIAAARQVQAQTHCVWLLFGGKNDAALVAQIQSGIGNRAAAINLAGQTTLRELMALLKRCRVLLTNDTGPMHLAAALGTPVVTPFGSTSPELTGPGLPGDPRHHLLQASVSCAPCFLRECPIDFRCMNGIGVERIVQAVLAATGGFEIRT